MFSCHLEFSCLCVYRLRFHQVFVDYLVGVEAVVGLLEFAKMVTAFGEMRHGDLAGPGSLRLALAGGDRG